MYQSTYFVEKSSNTFADNLAAFGLAYVLSAIASGRAGIRLEDRGSVYAVVCEPDLKSEWVAQRSFFAGAPFLVTLDKKTQQKVVKGANLSPHELPQFFGDLVVDYQDEKSNNESFYNWLKTLPAEDKRKAVRGELEGPGAPHIQWDVFRAINPSSLQGYNGLMAEWWRSREAFPELLGILLRMTCKTPNDTVEVREEWKKLCQAKGWRTRDATAMQLFNPAQGKGISSAKAEWSNPNNLKSFWLLEWLKAVGLFHGGITRIVANPRDPRNAKDRKTYVLMPLNLEWGRHQEVMKDFRKAMVGSSTAVKLDILVSLRYTMAFLKHYEKARVEDLVSELFGQSPGDLVSGMQMAFYKNLGNAIATMNIASINLPRWVVPRNPEDLAGLKEALDEHVSIAIGLDETRGDQYGLLSKYRDFLSGNDLEPFFEFTNIYSGFLISQRERGKFVRPFTTTTLEVLFMNSDDKRKTYQTIVQEPGFKNVAYAIRHSTVIPQSRKGQSRKGRGNRPSVDIRYGLGQQLSRKAAYPDEFLAELGEFLHLYNAENAQLREKNRNPFRNDVLTSDIEAIANLVDCFGSKVVCNMLVAYGYAREPYETKPENGLEDPAIEALSGDSDDDQDDEDNG